MYSQARTGALRSTLECEFGRKVVIAILTHDVREESPAGIEDLLQDIRQMLVDEGFNTAYTGSYTTLFTGQPGDEAWMTDFLDWVTRGCPDPILDHRMNTRDGIRLAMEFHLAVRDWFKYQDHYEVLCKAENDLGHIREAAGERLLVAAYTDDIGPIETSVKNTRDLVGVISAQEAIVAAWLMGKV